MLIGLINQHRKLIVALVGAAALILGAVYGETSTVYTTLISLATAFGVYQVPNEQ